MLLTIKAFTDVANFAKNCEGARIEKRINYIILKGVRVC